MASIGEELRGELRQRMAAMSPDERIALTATLAEADLDLFSTARQIPREAARRLLVRARRTGRLFSRAVEEAEP